MPHRYAISQLTSEFLVRSIEAAFRNEQLADSIRVSRLVIIALSLLVLLLGVNDLVVVGWGGDLLQRWAVRSVPLGVGIWAFITLWRPTNAARLSRVSALYAAVHLTAFAIVAGITPPLGGLQAGIFAVITGVYFLLQTSFLTTVAFALYGSLLYAGVEILIWKQPPAPYVMLLLANLFGALALRHLNMLRRSQFAAMRAAESSGEALQRLFMASPVPLALTRLSDGMVIMANDAAVEHFEWHPEALQDGSAKNLWLDPTRREAFVAKLNETGRVEAFEAELSLPSGQSRVFLLSAAHVEHAGEPCMIISAVDIEDRKRHEDVLRHLATTDALTQLPNRHYFFELAEIEVARACRYGRPVTVAMIDLDHFKKINDRYGHSAGDAVLRGFARTARSVLREIDVIARLGGEEFALLLPETDLAAAKPVAERLRQAVRSAPVRFGDQDICVTISAGVAEITPGDTIDNVLAQADDALYLAKQAGRDRVVAAGDVEPQLA